jgi:hypothetical protein
MPPPVPRCRAGRNPRSSHPTVSAFPGSAAGSACTSSFSRLAQRSLALRPAHSRSHQIVTANRRLQPFRYLHDCSDCFRRERIAGWALHPLESAALPRRTPNSGRSRDQDRTRGSDPKRSSSRNRQRSRMWRRLRQVWRIAVLPICETWPVADFVFLCYAVIVVGAARKRDDLSSNVAVIRQPL